VTPFLHPDSVLLGLALSIGVLPKLPLWAVAGILLGAGAGFFASPQPWDNIEGAAFTYPLGALMCGAIVVLALRWHPLTRLLSLRPMRFFGAISFGLYVFHLLGLHFAHTAMQWAGFGEHAALDLGPWALTLALGFAFTALMAVLSYYAIERPFLTLKVRFAVVHGR
jgi:peptidoglycan/LPS O-acetylase OafA/YrhL